MILNHANYQRYHTYEVGDNSIFIPPGEICSGKSQTIPDQAMTIRQIIDRFVRGQDVQRFDAQYVDDPLLPPQFDRFDEIEKAEYAFELGQALMGRKPKPDPKPNPVSDPVLPPSSPADGG